MGSNDVFVIKTHLFISSDLFVKRFKITSYQIEYYPEKLNLFEMLTLIIPVFLINLFKFICKSGSTVSIKEILNRKFYKIIIKRK